MRSAPMNKFLVLRRLQLGRVPPELMQTVLRHRDSRARLEARGRVLWCYHVVGAHGGAWIYDDDDSNEELDSVAAFEVIARAEMRGATPLGT